jgi:hypothetical protein
VLVFADTQATDERQFQGGFEKIDAEVEAEEV